MPRSLAARWASATLISMTMVACGDSRPAPSTAASAVTSPADSRSAVSLAPMSVADDVEIAPGESGALCPGRYRRLAVGPRGRLELAGGTYELDELRIAPGAQLVATGPTILRVSSRFDVGEDATASAASATARARSRS
jgi:hypothetical protein